MARTLADDELLQLRDQLEGKPLFLKVYNEVLAHLNGVVKGFDFLVDSWPDFKAVVVKPKPEEVEIDFLKNLYTLGSKDIKALADLLEQPDVVDWKKDTLFTCTDESLNSVVCEIIGKHCGKSSVSEACPILSVTSEDLILRPVPDGFKLSSLTPADAGIVNNYWKFQYGEQSQDYIEAVVRSSKSCCLYDSSGKLVGFALTYHHGVLGMLYVLEEHRGKGLAKVIMSQLVHKTLENNKAAYVMIEESNEVSIKLHEGLGFKKIPGVGYSAIRYTPKGCCKRGKVCCI